MQIDDLSVRGGGLFTKLRRPGAPTQVFADEDDVQESTSPAHARKESDNGG